MIAIIDYGLGNLGSIRNMLKRLGFDSQIISSPWDILAATKLILPGVGSFDVGMKNLAERAMIEPLNKKVIEDKTPILGICLGVQLCTQSSEEGSRPGLGWLNADTVRFRFDGRPSLLKIPHMGWNHIAPTREHPILQGLDRESRFYFVHSYHLLCHDPQDVLTTTGYGFDFPSAVQRRNIIGVQFHPEKSHKFGMRLLMNFAEYRDEKTS